MDELVAPLQTLCVTIHLTEKLRPRDRDSPKTHSTAVSSHLGSFPCSSIGGGGASGGGRAQKGVPEGACLPCAWCSRRPKLGSRLSVTPENVQVPRVLTGRGSG